MSLYPLLKRRLENGQLAGREVLLDEYLKHQADALNAQPENDAATIKIASEIANLGRLEVFDVLTSDSVYARIFRVAESLALSEYVEARRRGRSELLTLIDTLQMPIREQLRRRLTDSGKLSGNEDLLKAYFESAVALRNLHPELEEEIAHDLFGIIQSKAFEKLTRSNPYVDILFIAGELELPPAHRDETATWDSLAVRVRALPDKAKEGN